MNDVSNLHVDKSHKKCSNLVLRSEVHLYLFLIWYVFCLTTKSTQDPYDSRVMLAHRPVSTKIQLDNLCS